MVKKFVGYLFICVSLVVSVFAAVSYNQSELNAATIDYVGVGNPNELERRTLKVGDDLSGKTIYFSSLVKQNHNAVLNGTSAYVYYYAMSSVLYKLAINDSTVHLYTGVQLITKDNVEITTILHPANGTLKASYLYPSDFGKITSIKITGTPITNEVNATNLFNGMTADFTRVFDNLSSGKIYRDSVTQSVYTYNGATWVANSVYDVSYTTYGPETIPTSTGWSYIDESLLVTPVNGSKHFMGWYYNYDSYNKIPSNPVNVNDVITSNVMLYAHFIDGYKITFNSYGGTVIADITNVINVPETLPEPTRSMSIFDGWYYESSFTTKVNSNDPIENNVTLHAKFLTVYDVTFISNGGSAVTKLTSIAYYPNEFEIPTRVGYKFLGWCVDESLTTLAIASDPIYSNKTLYAKWEINRFTITYDSRGGTIFPSVSNSNSLPFSLPTPTRDNSIFLGWYYELTFNTMAVGGEFVDRDVTLYAKWLDVYDITFNSNGGSVVESINDVNNLPEVLPITSKQYFSFGGWYYESTFDTIATSGAAIYSNKTLFAKWNPIQHTITYSVDGVITTATVNEGNSYTFETPIKEGFTFSHWVDESSNVYTGTILISSDLYLYAEWDIIILDTPTNLSFARGQKLLSWNAVPGAISYDVYYYITVQGFGTEYKLLGNAANPYYTLGLDFTGLNEFVDIRFKVKAISSDPLRHSLFSDVTIYYRDLAKPIIGGLDTYEMGISNVKNYQEIVDSITITDNTNLFTDLIIVTTGTYITTNITFGQYNLLITVTDLDGNVSSKTITIIIYDDIAPVVVGPKVILKSSSVTFTVANIMDKFTCSDNKDSICVITLMSAFDEYTGKGTTPGMYNVKFTSTDENGNIGYASVDVIVDSSIPPVLLFDGTDITVNKDTILTTNDFIVLLKKTNVIDSNKTFEITWNSDNYSGTEEVIGVHSLSYSLDYLDGTSDTNTFTVNVIETAERVEREKSFFEKIGDFFSSMFYNIGLFFVWLWSLIVGLFNWLFNMV